MKQEVASMKEAVAHADLWKAEAVSPHDEHNPLICSQTTTQVAEMKRKRPEKKAMVSRA